MNAAACNTSRIARRLSPRRKLELDFVREPAFAAWVAALCPDRGVAREHEAGVLATIARIRADRLHFVSFFPIESAGRRLCEPAA